jgi:hypothetical protein
MVEDWYKHFWAFVNTMPSAGCLLLPCNFWQMTFSHSPRFSTCILDSMRLPKPHKAKLESLLSEFLLNHKHFSHYLSSLVLAGISICVLQAMDSKQGWGLEDSGLLGSL